MDKQAIITAVIGAVTAIGGGLLGKRLEKAKAKKIAAEADSISVETTERAVGMWEDLNKQLHHELGILRTQIGELRKENVKLHDENLELKKQIDTLSGEVNKLKKIIE